MINFLLAFYAFFAFAVNFSVVKFYQKYFADGLKSTLLYPVIYSVAMTLFPLVLNGFKLQANLFAVLMALLLAFILIMQNIITIFAYKNGKVSISTMFLMLGGMLLPYIYGIIFSSEKPSVFAIIGMVVLTVSLFIPLIEKKQSEKVKPLFIFLCLIIFLLNGSNGVVCVIHQKSASAIDTNSFLAWCGIFQFALSLPVYLVYSLISKAKIKNAAPAAASEPVLASLPEKTGLEKRLASIRPIYKTLISIACVLTAVLISCSGSLSQLIAAKTMDSTVLFPIITGGMIVLMSISGSVLFKEKMTLSILIGIILSAIGTVLFIF